jgi:hypothetical protein
MRMRGSCVCWLVAFGALGCAITVPALPAQAYTAEPAPWSICTAEQRSNQIVEEHAKLLSPAAGTTVTAGTPVTFSAESGGQSPMTFMIASSLTLLSSPDIGGGPGSLVQPEYHSEYTFTSTTATATPRTIYWTASFTRTLKDCEGPPVTFTLPARTLTVLPTAAEEQATDKKQAEEAAAKKKQAEGAAALLTGAVSLPTTYVATTPRGQAALELTCTGTDTCAGKLVLSVKSTTGKHKHKHARAQTIGTASFSIPPGATVTVDVTLDAAGRALLSAHHRRLNSTLTIVKSTPAPAGTRTDTVQLVQQKAHGKKKK